RSFVSVGSAELPYRALASLPELARQPYIVIKKIRRLRHVRASTTANNRAGVGDKPGGSPIRHWVGRRDSTRSVLPPLCGHDTTQRPSTLLRGADIHPGS